MSDFLNSIIPSAPVAASIDNPRVLLIYSDLKVGKSALASWLSMNEEALWIDYENGSEGMPGMKLNVIRKVDELNVDKEPKAKIKKVDFCLQLWNELAKANPTRFKYVVHDKIDNLETWAEGWATAMYKNSIIGRNFTGSTVLELPEGGGFLYLRERFNELWTAAVQAAPRTIFLASLRSKYVGTKGDSMVSSNDIDLTGKLRKIAVGFADAIGYMNREPDGANYLSFMTAEKGAFCGCRIPRLEGKRFKLSWRGPDGKLNVNWKELYVD